MLQSKIILCFCFCALLFKLVFFCTNFIFVVNAGLTVIFVCCNFVLFFLCYSLETSEKENLYNSRYHFSSFL